MTPRCSDSYNQRPCRRGSHWRGKGSAQSYFPLLSTKTLPMKKLCFWWHLQITVHYGKCCTISRVLFTSGRRRHLPGSATRCSEFACLSCLVNNKWNYYNTVPALWIICLYKTRKLPKQIRSFQFKILNVKQSYRSPNVVRSHCCWVTTLSVMLTLKTDWLQK